MEDLDSWEVVPSPYVQQQSSSSTPFQEEDLGVFVKENFYDESAVFPPSEHEGLEVSKEESFETSSSSSSSFSACSESEDEDLQQAPEPDSWLGVSVHQMSRQMRQGISNLSRRIVSATSSFWPCSACRAKIWTLNSLTAFMTAVAFTLAYARMNRWRHKQALEQSKHTLLILLRQQEQKISQLLLQIAQMNEMLSARRRVRVIYAY